MKKILFLVVAGLLMSAGVARADRGIWFGVNAGDTAGILTFVNVINTTTGTVTATVEFMNQAGVAIGSTTKSLATNELWNFDTTSIGTISTTNLDDGVSPPERGMAKIYGGGGDIKGYTTQFISSTNSGFNFRFDMLATE